MPSTKPILSDAAPSPKGPYSHAVVAGGLLFCSAQIGVDRATGALAVEVGEQAAQALKNLEAICQAAGTTLARATRLTLYMLDLADMPQVNQAFADVFGDTPPARSTFQAAALVGGARVGIDAIVALP